MRRKVTLISTAVALVGVIVVSGTLAFFTDTATVNNVVTTGNVKIKMDEQKIKLDTDNKQMEAVVDGDEDRTEDGQSYDAMPGTELYKDPVITNTGKDSAWLKVKIEVKSEDGLKFQTEDASETTSDIVWKQIKELLNGKDGEGQDAQYIWAHDGTGNLIIDQDGYIFLNKVFAPNDRVPVFKYDYNNFFDYVNTTYGDVNLAQNASFDINVFAQAAQSENNGASAQDASFN
ncbi:MAG: SipW-dependent-type signal peptide-containing protein [bacterium]|nr:SipW-dependent-type signal peptide-containing protein [bacterium]